MNESDFLHSLRLRIKACEPLIWIETPDDDWILEALRRELTPQNITFDITDDPRWEEIDKYTQRTVIAWTNLTTRDCEAHASSLIRLSRQLRTTVTLVILSLPGNQRPQFLSHVPVLVAPLPGLNARKALAQLVLGSFARDAKLLNRIAYISAGLTRTQLYRVLTRCLLEAKTTNDMGTSAFPGAPASSFPGSEFNNFERNILNEKKQLLSSNLSLEIIDDHVSLDDIGGVNELKIWLRQRTAVFTEQARKFGLMPPKGLLLVGVPGCGKSLIAKAIANVWNFPLLKLDISSIFANHDESPDAVLARALSVADTMSPAVIWCDEIEKAFGKGADPTTRRLLGHILSWLQERKSNAFFVATANDVRELPSELVRKGRFDELFFVDLPDEDARADIFRIHLRKRHRNTNLFNCNELAEATNFFSGAEIEQTVIAALFNAFSQNRDITQDDILDTIQDTIPLYKQREDDIKRLREWASERTRMAANNARMLSYFS